MVGARLAAITWIENAGSEALAEIERADAAGLPYDVVLLDWKMPSMDGIALGPDYPGSLFVDFQRRILGLQQRGFPRLGFAQAHTPALAPDHSRLRHAGTQRGANLLQRGCP